VEVQDHLVALQKELMELIQLSLEQQPLAVEALVVHHVLRNQEHLVDPVVAVDVIVLLEEVEQLVKVTMVEAQVVLLEKVALVAVELELLEQLVEMLQEQQVEQEVHLLLYLL
jgi:hypothetical protein